MSPGARRVWVAGGGSGIGRGIAEALAVRGGSVVVSGRRPEPLEAVAAAHPGRVHALPVDLADAASREGVLSRARTLMGGLDGVVYCAGSVVHEPLGQVGEDALRSQLEINLVVPLRIAEQALTELEPGGALVFVASTLAHRPVPTSVVYSAAKAGMLAVMKTAALTGAARGVRVNAVSPGIVDTDMVRTLRPGEASIESQLEAMRRLHPLGRLGTPADVADAVIHLLTAPWTTGTELLVDGGLLLRE